MPAGNVVVGRPKSGGNGSGQALRKASALHQAHAAQEQPGKEFVYVEGAGGSDLEDEEDEEEDAMDEDSGSDEDGQEEEEEEVRLNPSKSAYAGSGKKWLLSQGHTAHEEEEEEHEEQEEEEEEKKAVAAPKAREAAKAGNAQSLKYRQRVLILSSRGITHRYRHLLNDLHAILPHSKKDAKLDGKGQLTIINELAELTNCNNCIFFDIRKHQDLYMWVAKTPNGPSARFLVENVHTMDELKLTGNCLKGSRPLLSFDAAFDSQPHLQLLKEMFIQTFSTPRTSRKMKPFIDHVLSFSIIDGKIWFRHYQIVEKVVDKQEETSLVEIGPRFVMNLMRIFDGSFGGSTLYENSTFITPNDLRRAAKAEVSMKYKDRAQAQAGREARGEANQLPEDPLAKVFH